MTSPGELNIEEAIKNVAGKVVTIYIINTLDQTVTVQIKGNRVESTLNASNIGGSFTIGSNSADYRTLVAEQSGILPYIYLELSCSTAPANGNVVAYLIKESVEELLVDALEIRDTNAHSPDTDPNKIFVRRWW